MSQHEIERVIGRAATDSAFRQALIDNAREACKEYDLTEDELDALETSPAQFVLTNSEPRNSPSTQLVPIFLALALYGATQRVFRFEPCLAGAAPVRRIDPLRHDPLETQSAGVLEHGRTSLVNVFVELDRVLGLADQFYQLPLAVEQWSFSQVDALMLDQVEREQHCISVEETAAQGIEIRKAIIATDDRLAVDQERLRRHPGGGLDDGREPVGPVISAACEAPDPRAFTPDHQPEAVVLNLMHP